MNVCILVCIPYNSTNSISKQNKNKLGTYCIENLLIENKNSMVREI